MSGDHASTVHAVVQAGGRGERLRPLTLDRPKPMLEVGGMPMVERVVRGLLKAGIDRITLIVGYKSDAIRKHLNCMSLGGATVDVFEETESLGNVGALGQLDLQRRYCLLAFGDLVTDLDFAELVRMGMATRSDILLASHEEQHRLQLGELVVEGDRVLGYREKPLKTFLICSGIGLLRRECLSVIPTDGRPFGLSDLITAALAAGHTADHWKHGAFWMDVNTLEALKEANRRVQARVAHDQAIGHA